MHRRQEHTPFMRMTEDIARGCQCKARTLLLQVSKHAIDVLGLRIRAYL